MPRSALFCALLLLAQPLAAAQSQAPVDESLDLGLVTLSRLTLKPLPMRSAGLLPPKASFLPASVRPYLKPTHQLDVLSGPVQKAAGQVRRAVAPGRRQADRLRNSRALAEAVGLWLDTHLAVSGTAGAAARPSVDLRLAYPTASALLKAGSTDPDGRVLLAVALLRALKVPARVALARGALTAQIWVALPPQRRAPAPRGRGKRARATARPAQPLGWWEPMDPALSDAEIDAWSMDASGLERLRWRPQQELAAAPGPWERAVFDAGDSAAARAAFDASLALGRLTGTALARPLSAAAAAYQSLSQGSATLWVLTAQRWNLSVQGAMAGMDSMQLLTPYRPALNSWGREQQGAAAGLDIEAQGVWSDRPQRLRLFSELEDEWSSPPPALGMLHWYKLAVRRHSTVLQARRSAGRVEGVVLRCDNLTPRAGYLVQVSAEGTTQTAEGKVADDGTFGLVLDHELDAAQQINVRAIGAGNEGDSQCLERQND